MKKLICTLTRHKWDQTDWHFYECKRCGEMWGVETELILWGEPFSLYLIFWLVTHLGFIWRNRVKRYEVFSRCPDCRKPEWVLWRQVGKHRDCIPF